METIYVGFRRDGGPWQVKPVHQVTTVDLEEIDWLRDFRSTLLVSGDDDAAGVQIVLQAQSGEDPFAALWLDGHDCRGLELVREQVRKHVPESRHRAPFPRRR